MSNRTNTEQEVFIQKYYASESPFYQGLRNKAVQNHCDHMIVAPSEARTLKFLVELTKSKKVVEIGCLYGLTCLRMAEGLPSDGCIWTFEKNPENAEIAQKYFNESPQKDKIQLVVGDAIAKLPSIEDQGPFDCVFIDADKVGYPLYLAWAYQNLKPQGLVILDNTFQAGGVWGSEDDKNKKSVEAMLIVHEELAHSKKWTAHTLPSFDGITVGIKN